ncbi:MAG TPA: hypothetical protein VGM82_18085 [Gemmatimonadaceae bacterium]|jgi:hypothetical protein
MNAEATAMAEQEPIGIVISRGSHLDHAPTFFAYVWADDPEPSDAVEIATTV